MNWFRVYAEMMDDPKVGTLEDSAFRLWVDVLCLAAQGDGTGATGLDVAGLAWRVRRPVEGVRAAVAAFVDRGLVALDDAGRIAVPAWERRQRPSDRSTDRVRAYRQRRSGETVSETVTKRDGNANTSPPLPSPLVPPHTPPYNPPTLTPTTTHPQGAGERDDGAGGEREAVTGDQPTAAGQGGALVLTGGEVSTPVEILPSRSGMVPITADQADTWQRVYPAVNVRAELGRVFAWLDANPRQRPTEKGVRRFVNQWLSREQDRAAERGARPHLRAIPGGGGGGPLESRMGRAVAASLARASRLEGGE